jgi:pimeloyl-ACP methyl ester carboxylesterase/DNA-binding CsgD family transcriptional regulator
VVQQIGFATSVDHVRLAWARHGTGPPLLRVATWMTHIDRDWDSPVWGEWLRALGARFTVVRYDERGCGLSDRNPPALDLDHWVADLEAVAQAAELKRFALLGVSQGGAIATAFAARHPEQVSHLILYGAYCRGQLRRGDPQASENIELAQAVTRLGWGRNNPAFRRIFTSRFIPEGSEEQLAWFDELERLSTTPEMAAQLSLARASVDVTSMASSVQAPTLVLHADGDEAVPFEEGRLLASLIRGATFVPLHGRNHILLSTDTAWPEFLRALDAFSGAEPRPVREDASVQLSERELEVLRLVAKGYSNEDIAARLFLSVRTVERHLNHIYSLLGMSGRSARAAATALLPYLERAKTGG